MDLSRHQESSYTQILAAKQEIIWQRLAQVRLQDAYRQWLATIPNPLTKKTYQVAMEELFLRRFLDPDWTLQGFSLISLEVIIDRIKTEPIFVKARDGSLTTKQWSNPTRESRIACFLAFTRYLHRKTEGIIRRGIPSKEGLEKTFGPKPRQVKTPAMNRSQLVRFFEQLDKINPRDALIARVCLHGGKRINEVLSLRTEQLDYERKQITFHQSKSHLLDDITIISFEKQAASHLLEEIRKYIGQRSGCVFITSQSKAVQKTQVDRTFSKAGQQAGVPFRVSAHTLRVTAVTLWKEDGFSDSLIMKATGHASSEMVRRYDKSDLADNVTKISCLL
jgi:integrase/recombinase XerD